MMGTALKSSAIVIGFIILFRPAFSDISDQYIQAVANAAIKDNASIFDAAKTRHVPAFGPFPDPSLWTSEGLSRKLYSDQSMIVDLGRGVIRRDFADGDSVIQGLVFHGIPVDYVYHGTTLTWSVDMERIGTVFSGNPLIQHDADPQTLTTGVSFKQYELNAAANQESILTVNGNEFHVVSQNPLSIPQLSYIAEAILQMPSKTILPLMNSPNPEVGLYVFDSLGEKRSGDGKIVPVHGLAGSSAMIAIQTSDLDSEESAEKVLFHEAGHLTDRVYGLPSQSLLDKEGRPLFGQGEDSDFVSPTAKQNAPEDFAETHRELLMIRMNRLKENKTDIFDLPADKLDSLLQGLGYSERLREKMEKIASIYRS